MYFSLLVHPRDVETVLLSLFFLFLFFNALQGDNNNNNKINDLGHSIVVGPSQSSPQPLPNGLG